MKFQGGLSHQGHGPFKGLLFLLVLGHLYNLDDRDLEPVELESRDALTPIWEPAWVQPGGASHVRKSGLATFNIEVSSLPA